MLVTERDCWSLFPRETGMGTIPSHGALCSTGLSTCVRTWMSFQTQKENQNYNKEMEGTLQECEWKEGKISGLKE